MGVQTIPFDAAEFLDDEASQTELLADAFASGDSDVIVAAVGMVARARGMGELAKKTGLSRGGLYAALKEGGNPTLETILKVLNEFGIGLTVKKKNSQELARA